MSIEKANDAEIQAFLNEQPLWVIRSHKLHREYVFGDFVTAFGFMSEAALLAERGNHHPEWCNVYRNVTVHLTTHEAGGITTRDFILAAGMEAIAKLRLA